MYRGTKKKSSALKKLATVKTGKYTDKKGTNGKYYYYRVVLKVYDQEGKLVASTKLAQCKYGSRLYNTKG